MHGIKGESAICATNTLQFLTVPQEARTNQNRKKLSKECLCLVDPVCEEQKFLIYCKIK